MNAIETPTITVPTAVEPQAPVKSRVPDFGSGMFSKVMKELYEDSQRLLDLSPPQAERLAWSLGSDMGKHQQQASGIRIGSKSKNKDNYTVRTLCDAIKGCPAYFSTDLLKLCAMLDDCKRYGMENVTVELTQTKMDWLNKK